MKKSELLKEMQLSATDFNRLAAARGVEIKSEYSDEEVALLKSGGEPNQPTASTTFPHTAQEQPETTAIDITQRLQSEGELALADKAEGLSDAQQRGSQQATDEALVEFSAYATTRQKRRKQINSFKTQFRQGLDAALTQVAVEPVEDEDDTDFFGSVPTFSPPTLNKSLPAS